MCDTSFFDLPFEIKIHIFKYLDVVTLLKICELYPTLKECTKEKQFNEYFNLSGLYDLKKGHFKSTALLATFRAEAVTTLNINSLYWIPRKTVLSFISKLCNLKRLYAIDTILDLEGQSMSALGKLHKLEELAVGFHYTTVCPNFYIFFEQKLIKLFLFGTFTNFNLFNNIVEALKNLKEVWLITSSGLPDLHQVNHLPRKLEKYTLNVCFLDTFIVTKEVTLTHQTGLNQLSFADPSKDCHLKLYNINEKYDNLFDKIVGKYCYPFCKKEAEEMVLKSILPSDMNLTVLNLKHDSCYGDKLMSSIRKILLSDNTKKVKKLAINFCLCPQSMKKSKEDDDYQPLFKKRRIGVPNKGYSKSVLEEIVDHMTLLQELEIWECSIISDQPKLVTNNSLTCIQKLQDLQKLSLHSLPVYVDGKFLIPIAKNCKRLRSLKLNATRNLNSALFSALKYMTNLKDLLFVQADMNLQQFFETALENENLKLNRICFHFNGMNLNDVTVLDKFLEKNDQLIFFGLVFPVAHFKRKLFNRIFNKYRIPQRVFLVAPSVSVYDSSVPLVHVTQMVNYSSEVGGLDIFKDFFY